MFVAIEDPSVDYAGSCWFPPPFGFPTTCKPLEDWKKTTHYKRITSKWSITWTNQLLDDYTRTVKDWLEVEVRKRKESKTRSSIYPPTFTLDGANYTTEVLAALEKKVEAGADDSEEPLRLARLQRNLTAALLYFSTYVLDEEMKQSLWAQNYIVAADESHKHDTLSWAEARTTITWGLKAEDPLALLTELLTERRSDRMNLYRWISVLRSLRVRLEKLSVTLPESFYLKLVDRQMMSNERRLMDSWLTAQDESERKKLTTWYTTARKHDDPTACPTFRVSSVRHQLKLIPERPTKSHRTNDEKSGKGEEEVFPKSNKNKKNKKNKNNKNKPEVSKEETPEKKSSEPRRSTRNTSQKSCYRCGGKDHKGPWESKCPHHLSSEEYAKKKAGKKHTTFTVEEAEPPEVTLVEESSFVLADFSGPKPYPVHDITCGQFWRAKAGQSDWDVSKYNKYKAHLILNRNDCTLDHKCCGRSLKPLKPDSKANTTREATGNEAEEESDVETWMVNSRSSIEPICKAKVQAIDHKGVLRTITVALDSGSNRDICLKPLATRIIDRSSSSTRVCGGDTKLGPLVTVKLVKPGQSTLELTEVRVGSKAHIPHGCHLLLGRGTLKALRVAMDWHIDYSGHDIPRLRVRKELSKSETKEAKTEKLGRAEAKSLPESKSNPLLNETTREEVFLAEAKVKSFLERNSDSLFKVKELSLDEIRISNELPTDIRLDLEAANRQLSTAFAQTNKVPKHFKCEPHVIPLKNNFKVQRAAPRRRGPYSGEYLRQWALKEVEQGGYEPCEGLWASEMHLAFKAGPEGKNDPSFDIRPCGDYVAVNEQCEKMAPEYPSREQMSESFAGCIAFYGSDGIQAYRQFLLAPESRPLLAVRTPIGLIQPVGMPFGYINAGTVLMHGYKRMMNKLPQRQLANMRNFFDDFLGGVRELRGEFGLVACWRRFLSLCIEHGLTLKPSKTFIGFPTATFLGYTVTGRTVQVSADALEPIRRMKEPHDRKSLRSALGVFVSSSRMIPNYSIRARPLTRLTGKEDWVWRSDVEAKAFQSLKASVLASYPIFAPRWDLSFHGMTDASDFGMAGWLFQLVPTEGEGCCPALHIPSRELVEELGLVEYAQLLARFSGHCIHTIRFLSKPFNKAMMARPTYYKEAKAIFWFLKECKFYLVSSPFEVRLYTDHAPLQWIKHSRRGPVSAWMVEDAGLIQFSTEYWPGPINVISDALSRYPFVVPLGGVFHGSEAMWSALLDKLEPWCLDALRVWVFAGYATITMARLVQQWRRPKNALVKTAPKSKPEQWDLALLAPAAEVAPVVAYQLLAKPNLPFAMLLPSDLVNFISLGTGRVADEKIQSLVDDMPKIYFLDSSLVWILHACGADRDYVFAGEELDTPSTDKFEMSPALLQLWVAEQATEIKQYEDAFGQEAVVQRADGLVMVLKEREASKIVVPTARRQPLVLKAHEQLAHRGPRKILNVLRVSYIWPKMSSDVHKWLRDCIECLLAKANRNLAHGLFRAVEFGQPGEAYGVDFYWVATSDDGMSVIMVVVDLFSRLTMFIALTNQQATSVIRALLEDVVFRRGAFKVMVSDADPALLSMIVQGLIQALGCEHIVTYGWPQGNAVTERNMVVLGENLRILSMAEDQSVMRQWPRYCSRWSFAVNSVVNEHTSLPPLLVDQGWMPRQPFETDLMDVPKVDALLARKTTGVYGLIAKRQELFREVALRRSAAARMESNARLNLKGGPAVTYEVGEHVIAYVVPTRSKGPAKSSDSAPEDKKTKWKQKHKISWRGPCLVLKKLSATYYEVKELKTGKRFKRSVALLAPWRGEISVELKRRMTDTLVGKLVVTVDNVGDDTFSLAKVLQESDDSYQFHYYGTTDEDMERARFLPVFIENKTGLMLLGPPQKHERAKAWTGWTPQEDGYIILRDPKLTKSGRLSATTRRSLRARRLRHFVIPSDD